MFSLVWVVYQFWWINVNYLPIFFMITSWAVGQSIIPLSPVPVKWFTSKGNDKKWQKTTTKYNMPNMWKCSEWTEHCKMIRHINVIFSLVLQRFTHTNTEYCKTYRIFFENMKHRWNIEREIWIEIQLSSAKHALECCLLNVSHFIKASMY